MIKLLMTLHFTRFYPVDLVLVFCMAFQRFIKPVARSALLFHLSAPTTTTLPLTLLVYLSQFRPNSFSFADWAKQYKHSNGIMCSLDVCSLFTNVPLDETIQICLDKLYSLSDPPTLPRAVLHKLLEFATKRSHFLFDGQYYDQIDGVAMGSPLGPVLANIFMCHFEERWVMNGKVRPSLWYRYVDDTFTMFDSKDTACEFLQYLNSRHHSIKFTIEFEQDNVIPFLDILVKRCPNNTFVTSIYRKKTFTGLYTKWDSFTPRKYKINLIRTLTYRCYRICSSASLLQSALDDLRKLLLQNGYPQGIITYNVNDILNKNRNKPNSPVSTVPKKDIIILLPYLCLESNQISKRLKSCVYNFYSFVNLRIIFQNTRRIKSFFPYKDRLNRSQQSKVIYKACCWDCDDFYIGKTKRRLHDRNISRPSLKLTTRQPLLTMSKPQVTTSSGIISKF